jgi:hypothetical protein
MERAKTTAIPPWKHENSLGAKEDQWAINSFDFYEKHMSYRQKGISK